MRIRTCKCVHARVCACMMGTSRFICTCAAQRVCDTVSVYASVDDDASYFKAFIEQNETSLGDMDRKYSASLPPTNDTCCAYALKDRQLRVGPRLIAPNKVCKHFLAWIANSTAMTPISCWELVKGAPHCNQAHFVLGGGGRCGCFHRNLDCGVSTNWVNLSTVGTTTAPNQETAQTVPAWNSNDLLGVYRFPQREAAYAGRQIFVEGADAMVFLANSSFGISTLDLAAAGSQVHVESDPQTLASVKSDMVAPLVINASKYMGFRAFATTFKQANDVSYLQQETGVVSMISVSGFDDVSPSARRRNANTERAPDDSLLTNSTMPTDTATTRAMEPNASITEITSNKSIVIQRCRCIEANGVQTVLHNGGRAIQYNDTSGTQHLYPASYGTKMCKAHDVSLPPNCADVSGQPRADTPTFCGQSFAFTFS